MRTVLQFRADGIPYSEQIWWVGGYPMQPRGYKRSPRYSFTFAPYKEAFWLPVWMWAAGVPYHPTKHTDRGISELLGREVNRKTVWRDRQRMQKAGLYKQLSDCYTFLITPDVMRKRVHTNPDTDGPQFFRPLPVRIFNEYRREDAAAREKELGLPVGDWRACFETLYVLNWQPIEMELYQREQAIAQRFRAQRQQDELRKRAKELLPHVDHRTGAGRKEIEAMMQQLQAQNKAYQRAEREPSDPSVDISLAELNAELDELFDEEGLEDVTGSPSMEQIEALKYGSTTGYSADL